MNMQDKELKKKNEKYSNPFGLFCLITFLIFAIIIAIGAIYTQLNK